MTGVDTVKTEFWSVWFSESEGTLWRVKSCRERQLCKGKRSGTNPREEGNGKDQRHCYTLEFEDTWCQSQSRREHCGLKTLNGK